MSLRAALRAADLVLCEDSRVSARMLERFGLRVRLAPLHDHNEEGRIPEILALLREGRRVVLISDAGMPLVSDPGYRLVRAALADNLPVNALPGANAATLATLCTISILTLLGWIAIPNVGEALLQVNVSQKTVSVQRQVVELVTKAQILSAFAHQVGTWLTC
jgi:hypothetical protein